MVTLEARAYGVARYLRRETGAWTIVNDVAGFIGPEVFRTSEQLQRACLEDVVMAKLHGLTMGLDVCATFHMGIEPAALRRATQSIVELAAPAYLMAVAGNADPMLGYLTTSFREHPRLRARSGRRMTSAMQTRLGALGVLGPDGEIPRGAAAGPTTAASLYAVSMKEGGDRRTSDALREEGLATIGRVRARGYDLGYGHGPDCSAPPAAAARMELIYTQARRALYAALDAGVVRDVSPHHLRVRTRARDREAYLTHPDCGEAICDEDATELLALRGSAVGGVQIVHLIGERPGTGLDTLSAYLTYGRDRAGQLRWSRDLDHAATTAVCGIHPRGKPPDAAAREISRTVARILDHRCSGVLLKP